MPGSRIGPIQLSQDVTSFLRALVDTTLDNADELRNNADGALYMSDEEYFTFIRMQDKWVVLGGGAVERGGAGRGGAFVAGEGRSRRLHGKMAGQAAFADTLGRRP